ncbi:MAG: peptidyl-prolyl cis-trans isomerase [Gemmatimonadetes bacterium]|nr:peptidyl-prolyl cis-trans isomerase [Gemmatimonadota bacterium]
MMRAMRANAKWIMLFVTLAFVGWMVFDVGMDITGQGGATLTDAAARVNGVKIDLQTWYDALRRAQDEQRARGLGYANTLEEQRAFEDAVLEGLIQEILLRQEYARRRIRVSTAEIIAAAQTSPPPEIIQSEQFHTDGRFDPDKYRRFLASNVDPTFTMALEARYREEIPRIKLYEQLLTDVYVSNAKLWHMYRDEHDSVTVQLLELIPNAMVADSEITLTDEDVQAYYREHREDFSRPAAAYTSFISTSRLTNGADSAAALERAQALRQEIVDGADFAEIASRESADSTSRLMGGDLGPFARGGLIPEFEQAVLALRTGQISEPVLTAFGYHVIKRERVTSDSIHASHVLIAVELAGEHLDEVESRADSMDLLAAEQDDPTALDDVADMMGIPVASAPVVIQGSRMVLGGRVIPDAGLWAFEAIVDEISTVIETDWGFYLFRLDSLHAEGVPPLDDVEASVRRAALAAKKWDRARAIAADIATNLRAGQHLAEAALEHLLNFTTVGPMTRRNPAPRLAGLPAVAGASFGLGVGETSAPIETDRGIYFVEPTAKYLADSTTFVSQAAIMRIQVLASARQDRVQRFLLSLRSGANVIDRRRDLERIQRQFDRDNEGRFNPFNPLGY